MKYFFFVISVSILLVGCGRTEQPVNTPAVSSPEVVETTKQPIVEETTSEPEDVPAAEIPAARIAEPIAEYATRRTFKAFGEYISDRFNGYHVGDDVEYTGTETEVAVNAIADGTVKQVSRVSGYGGLIIIEHTFEDKTVTALYGHIDLSSATVSSGDTVSKGQFIANLGAGESDETDGERKHLHFAVFEGTDSRLNGYEQTAGGVNEWLNPQDLLTAYGLQLKSQSRLYNPSFELGGDMFNIEFTIPAGWELEYIPSLQALNLFTLSSAGTARERSQIFIRFFDANQFLTLTTVTIHSTTDLTVGVEDYIAKQYDIEKKPDRADFVDQPSWRNARHIVTDLRGSEGQTRYYVVAKNPKLDPALYQTVLDSIKIRE